MGFGGPVWHASICCRLHTPAHYVEEFAEIQLEGVGDKELGEWREHGVIAFHLRRRLSAEEEVVIGAVKDIRGTPEVAERLAKVRRFLPKGWTE